MKGTLEQVPTESLEKWPPGWANYEYDPDDVDDEQDNKRLRCRYAGLKITR